jgi:uncharacterized protein
VRTALNRKREIGRNFAILQAASRLLETGLSRAEVLRRKPEALLALRRVHELAEGGEGIPMMALGWVYSTGFFVKKDLKRAADYYEAAAKLGKTHAQYYLGSIYQHGLGREPQPRLAFKWMGLVARRGHPDAMYRYGWMLLEGFGARRNRTKGMQFLERAARKGSLPAAVRLALALGEDRPGRDALAAVVWYRRAARRGDIDSMNNLGVCYARGDGVKRSARRALEWYEKAARLGDKVAKENIRELKAKVLAERRNHSAKRKA